MVHNVRISDESDHIIQKLQSKTGRSKIQIIEEALEGYYYKEKMRLLGEEYEKYRSDDKLWEKELVERADLDGTLSDGLEEE